MMYFYSLFRSFPGHVIRTLSITLWSRKSSRPRYSTRTVFRCNHAAWSLLLLILPKLIHKKSLANPQKIPLAFISVNTVGIKMPLHAIPPPFEDLCSPNALHQPRHPPIHLLDDETGQIKFVPSTCVASIMRLWHARRMTSEEISRVMWRRAKITPDGVGSIIDFINEGRYSTNTHPF